jgi:hypothetical protein
VADSKNQARQGAMAELNCENLSTEELQPSPVPVAEDHRLLSGSGLTMVLSDEPGAQKISIVVPLSSDSREESKQPHDLEYLRYRLRNCLSPERLAELKKSQAERVQQWKTERHDGFRELFVGWLWDFAGLLPADTPRAVLPRLLHEHAELILSDSDTKRGVLSIAKKHLSQDDYFALRLNRRCYSVNDIAGEVIAKLCGEAPHLDGVPSASATIGIAEAASDATTHALPIPDASVSTGQPADGAAREAATLLPEPAQAVAAVTAPEQRAIHSQRVEKVRYHYGRHGKPSLAKFYKPYNVKNPEFCAWQRQDWARCGQKKRATLDAAADKLPSLAQL